MICKHCGKKIISIKDFCTKSKCTKCANKYLREYYAKNFKSDGIRLYNRKVKDE